MNNSLLLVYKNLYGEITEESLLQAVLYDHQLLLKILEIPLVESYIKISILEILSTIVFNEKKDLFEHYVKDYNIKIRKVCFIT